MQVIHADVILLVAWSELLELFDFAIADLLCLLREFELIKLFSNFVHLTFTLFFTHATEARLASEAFLQRLKLLEIGLFQLYLLDDQLGHQLHPHLYVVLVQDGLEVGFLRA